MFPGGIYDPAHVKELHCGCYALLHGNQPGGTSLGLLKAMGFGACCVTLNTPDNAYAVKTEIGSDNKSLKATLYWYDQNMKKLFAKKAEQRKQVLAKTKALGEKKASLEAALKKEGMVAKFAKADLLGKAEIVAELAEKKLIRKE